MGETERQAKMMTDYAEALIKGQGEVVKGLNQVSRLIAELPKRMPSL
jgi:hypothetical protein